MFTKKLGFIGLGLMGSSICRNLIKKNYELIVYDINVKAMEKFQGKARIANNHIEVYDESPVILLSLPNSNIVEKVLKDFIDLGVKGKIIVDLSTSNPISTINLHKEIKKQGGYLIDAPLNAGPEEAEKGQAISMVAGDKAIINKLDYLFKSYCKQYNYLGKSGNAHIAKLVMNFLGLMYAILLCQIFPLTEKLGLDTKELFKIMDNEILSNWIFKFYGEKIINANFKIDFKLKHGLKDLIYMKNLYENFNVPAFTLDGGIDLLRIAFKNGKSELDFSECANIIKDFLNNCSKEKD